MKNQNGMWIKHNLNMQYIPCLDQSSTEMDALLQSASAGSFC